MLEQFLNSLNLIIVQTQNNFTTLAVILFVPWCVFLITTIDKNILFALGIIPRRLRGLPGILFAPILHLNFNHIFFNSIPLVVLSNFILINGIYFYLVVTLLIALICGICVWCFAQNAVHVGASGVITGYWGFLVVNIYQSGSITTYILGLLSVYYFAGIFFGIFPQKKGVSWESHLFGLVAGIITSYIMRLYPALFFYPSS